MNDKNTGERAQSRMRLHAALVHFPISAWTAAVVLDLTALFRTNPSLAGVDVVALTYLLLWVGLASACIALFAGMLEFAQLPEDALVSRTANRHMLLMGATFLCFLISGLAHPAANVLPLSPQLRASVSVLGLILMMVGAHYGGRLVALRHR